MINYTFKIDMNNGNGLVNFTFPPFQENSDVARLGEELDSGFMIFWSKSSKQIPIMSYIEYTMSDGTSTITRKFYVGRDEVKSVSKRSEVYAHNLELIELYKKTEKFLEATITFTQPIENDKSNYTLLDCIERIIRIIPLGETDGSHLEKLINGAYQTIYNYGMFPLPQGRIINEISSELKTELQKIEAPQFVFSNPTLREAIDGVLKYVNAVGNLDTRVVNGKTLRDVLGAEFYGYLKSLVSLNRPIYHRTLEQNIEGYSNNQESFSQNNIVEKNYNVSSVSHPNNDNYDYIRSSENDYDITDSNFCAVLPYPIKSILHFYVPVYYSIEVDQVKHEFKLLLDVASQILANDQYATKSLEEKRYYWRYAVNDNKIIMYDTFTSVLFTLNTIDWVLAMASYNYAVSQGWITDPKTQGISGTITMLNDLEDTSTSGTSVSWAVEVGTGMVQPTGGSVSNLIKNMCFRCDFTTEQNTRINSRKEDIEDTPLNCTSNMQQQDRVISFTNFANTIFSTSQRTGNADLEITCKHKVLSDLIRVGDYTTDGYVCVEAEYIYYREYIIGKYKFNKNYNRISSFIGINSDIRSFQMPNDSKTYERICKTEHYLEVGFNHTRTNDVVANNYYVLGKLMSYTFTLPEPEAATDIDYSKVLCAVIEFPNDNLANKELNNYYKSEFDLTGVPILVLPIITKGGGNTITFEFGFTDPIYCGTKIYEISDPLTKRLKKPIPYCYPQDYNLGSCTSIGFLRTIKYNLHRGYELTTSTEPNRMLPLDVKKVSSDKTNQAVYTSGNLLVLKDSSEILKFNHCISCLSVDEDITLGLAFTENNYAITGTYTDIAVYLCKDNLGKFAKNYLDTTNCKEINWKGQDPTPKHPFVVGGNATGTTDNYFSVQFNEYTKQAIQNNLTQLPNTYKYIVVSRPNENNRQQILYHIKINGENWKQPINFVLAKTRYNLVYDY